MTSKKTAILGIVAIIGVGLFLAVAMNVMKGAEVSRPPEHLTFAVATLVDSAPVLIAQQQGFFEHEGVKVDIKRYQSGKDAASAMLRGEADLATVADLPLIMAIMEGTDIRLIATISRSGRENSIVARKDRGITSPSHLRGKAVGVISGTTSEFLLDEILVMHGIPRSAITVVGLKPDESMDALLSGRVDAVSSWHPQTDTLLKKLGNDGVRFYGDETYQMHWNIVTRKDFVAEHKDAIRKVVEALDHANVYLRDNTVAAQEIVAKSLQFDPVLLREVWPEYIFETSLEQSFLMTLENQARWAIRRNRATAREVPNIVNFIYRDALQDVAPAAVTVIR